jgi:hypothetical protein
VMMLVSYIWDIFSHDDDLFQMGFDGDLNLLLISR